MKQAICRLFALGLLLLPGSVLADGGKHRIVNMPEPYTQECSGCHIAYQPNLLPARAWQNIMSNLERHYGTDASLDKELVQTLAAWLRDNAGHHSNASPPEDRITRTSWFYKEHRAIDASVWRLASVKSAANCQACHAQAERGRYDDDDLILPEGLSAAQANALRGHERHWSHHKRWHDD